jgi:hypothetical protein
MPSGDNILHQCSCCGATEFVWKPKLLIDTVRKLSQTSPVYLGLDTFKEMAENQLKADMSTDPYRPVEVPMLNASVHVPHHTKNVLVKFEDGTYGWAFYWEGYWFLPNGEYTTTVTKWVTLA